MENLVSGNTLDTCLPRLQAWQKKLKSFHTIVKVQQEREFFSVSCLKPEEDEDDIIIVYARLTIVSSMSTQVKELSLRRQQESIALNVLPKLGEFEHILMKVDKAFRIRKDKCKRLEWEITDLENQLEGIGRSTGKYADMLAYEETALSWTKQTFGALEEEWNVLCFTRSEEFSRVRQILDLVINEAKEMCVFFESLFRNWKSFLIVLNEDIAENQNTVSHISKSWLETQNALIATDEKISFLESSLLRTREISAHSKLDLERLMSKKRYLQSAIQQFNSKKKEKEVEGKNLETDLSIFLEENKKLQLIYLHEKELLDDLSELLLSSRCQWLSEIVGFNKNLHQISNELISYQRHFRFVFDQVQDNKAKLQLWQKEKLRFMKELEQVSVRSEQNQFYSSNLEAQKLDEREDITAVRSILHNVLRDHEETFQVSCNKLHELQDTQTLQSIAQTRLEKVQIEFNGLRQQIETRRDKMKQDCAQLEPRKPAVKAQLSKSKSARKVQGERLSMQDADLQSQQFEIDQVNISAELFVKHEELNGELAYSISEKNLMLQELELELMSLRGLRKTVTERIEEKRNVLNDKNQNVISSEEVSFPEGFTDEEESEIQKLVERELSKICKELQSKHDQEICALEDCREKIRQAMSNNMNIQNMKEDVITLENQCGENHLPSLIADSVSRSDRSIKNTSNRLQQGNIVPNKSANADITNKKPLKKHAVSSRKRKLESHAVTNDQSVPSKVSIEDLFAEDL